MQRACAPIWRQKCPLWCGCGVSELNQRNKETAIAFWGALDRASETPADIQSFLADDLRWDGFAPFVDSRTAAEYVATFVTPFYGAFDQVHRETHIVMGGVSDGRADGATDGRHWVVAPGTRMQNKLWTLVLSQHATCPCACGGANFLNFDRRAKSPAFRRSLM